MPVVVNEFEVVSERDAPAAPGAQTAQGDAARAELDPERLLAEAHERLLRVRAY